MQEKTAVLFWGHGSPMNIIEPSTFTTILRQWGQQLPKPRAVIMISAHWMTQEWRVTGAKKLSTLYDFYGFPQELYQKVYPASGDPLLAQRLVDDLGVHFDEHRGLDHGAWSVMELLDPDAKIPIVQISLNAHGNCYDHYRLGKMLASYREEGIMIVASGDIVHNLGYLKPSRDAKAYDWGEFFENTILQAIQNRDLKTVLEPYTLGESAKLSLPTIEHYYPLCVALGALDDDEFFEVVYQGFEHGSISLTSLIGGLA